MEAGAALAAALALAVALAAGAEETAVAGGFSAGGGAEEQPRTARDRGREQETSEQESADPRAPVVFIGARSLAQTRARRKAPEERLRTPCPMLPDAPRPSTVRTRALSLGLFLLLLPAACCDLGLGRTEPFSPAEYEEHARERREAFGPEFTVMVVPPFVVIGDGPREWVEADANEVVRVAAALLKRRFFDRDPAAIIDVLMLQSESSYDARAGSLWSPPSTPYGFYSPCDRAIYVNMSRGNGTLVHEMVHALMEATFPACPTWFNEGLASLYEHTDLSTGDLRGRVNWRLPGLQKAIKRRATIPLDALLSTSRGDFYDSERSGLNYAMARYLCFYLQEKGLLEVFFHKFVADQEKDPTGVETLRRVLGEKDLSAFQRRWEEEMLALVYP